EDLAVGGIGTASARPGDLDPLRTDLSSRLALEHHRHPLLAALGPAVGLLDQPLDRALAIPPPAVGSAADHVHRIDHTVHHNIIPWRLISPHSRGEESSSQMMDKGPDAKGRCTRTNGHDVRVATN